jgi:hypothetical protein
MVSGATWLVSIIWRTSAFEFAPPYAPHVIAAVITGATLARVLERRVFAIGLAVGATVAWIALELLATEVHDTIPRWSAPLTVSPLGYHALLALMCAPAAAAAASLRLAGRRDHRLLWLWISALLMLGTIIASLTLVTPDNTLPGLAVFFILGAPLVAGAITQVLAPYRMIWSCGGGAVIFVLIVLDQYRTRSSTDGILGPVLGMGMFVLLGALGSRIGWRLFRNKDPRTPPRANLPTATAS